MFAKYIDLYVPQRKKVQNLHKKKSAMSLVFQFRQALDFEIKNRENRGSYTRTLDFVDGAVKPNY